MADDRKEDQKEPGFSPEGEAQRRATDREDWRIAPPRNRSFRREDDRFGAVGFDASDTEEDHPADGGDSARDRRVFHPEPPTPANPDPRFRDPASYVAPRRSTAAEDRPDADAFPENDAQGWEHQEPESWEQPEDTGLRSEDTSWEETSWNQPEPAGRNADASDEWIDTTPREPRQIARAAAAPQQTAFQDGVRAKAEAPEELEAAEEMELARQREAEAAAAREAELRAAEALARERAAEDAAERAAFIEDNTMGALFIGARATAGKHDLKAVERDLRIKARYIEAIERLDVGALPKEAYLAGYVRSYARYLKDHLPLSPEDAFTKFKTELDAKIAELGADAATAAEEGAAEASAAPDGASELISEESSEGADVEPHAASEQVEAEAESAAERDAFRHSAGFESVEEARARILRESRLSDPEPMAPASSFEEPVERASETPIDPAPQFEQPATAEELTPERAFDDGHAQKATSPEAARPSEPPPSSRPVAAPDRRGRVQAPPRRASSPATPARRAAPPKAPAPSAAPEAARRRVLDDLDDTPPTAVGGGGGSVGRKGESIADRLRAGASSATPRPSGGGGRAGAQENPALKRARETARRAQAREEVEPQPAAKASVSRADMANRAAAIRAALKARKRMDAGSVRTERAGAGVSREAFLGRIGPVATVGAAIAVVAGLSFGAWSLLSAAQRISSEQADRRLTVIEKRDPLTASIDVGRPAATAYEAGGALSVEVAPKKEPNAEVADLAISKKIDAALANVGSSAEGARDSAVTQPQEPTFDARATGARAVFDLYERASGLKKRAKPIAPDFGLRAVRPLLVDVRDQSGSLVFSGALASDAMIQLNKSAAPYAIRLSDASAAMMVVDGRAFGPIKADSVAIETRISLDAALALPQDIIVSAAIDNEARAAQRGGSNVE